MTARFISDLLALAARRAPDRTALTRGTERVSWAELDAQATRIARRFTELGVRPKDRVAMIHEAGIPSIAAFWAVQKIGAESVDVPGHTSPETIGRALAECRPRAAVADGAQAARLDPNSLPDLIFGSRASGFRGAHALEDESSAELPALSDRSVHDTALTVYTSGTSGHPKGVMLSHENMLSNVYAANIAAAMPEHESLLLAVPLYFIHGRMQLLTFASLAGTIHLSAGFQFPEQVLKELHQTGASCFSGVPYHFTTLMERTTLATRPPPQLRRVLVTGGALPHAALKKLSKMLPGAGVHTAYGMTEASPRITYLGPEETMTRPNCAGRALPGVVLEILSSDGRLVPRGGIGEVAVRGPNVMKGYVSGDDGRIDAEGRLRTGDLGWIDADGYLYLSGRQSDLIKSAGERIFPREIEEVLDRHPDVAESAVLGTPDPTLGERLAALVVIKPGRQVDARALKAHALRWLPFVRAPRELHVVPTLPKTSSGKIDRASLRAALSKLQEP